MNGELDVGARVGVALLALLTAALAVPAVADDVVVFAGRSMFERQGFRV